MSLASRDWPAKAIDSLESS